MSPKPLENANLDSITAVVIGGTSLFGGRGNVFGSLLGALIVGVFDSGLSQAGVEPLWRTFAIGVLVIVAVGWTSGSGGLRREWSEELDRPTSHRRHRTPCSPPAG